MADMLISTMNDIPGYDVEEVLGEVFGLTVRSRNIGSQVGAGLKSLVGGELKGMTKMLAEGREHATQRLVEEAEGKGANAIIVFRRNGSDEENERLLERVNASGEIFIVHTKLDGRYVLRLAIGNARTTEDDVRRAWEVLNREAEG